MQTLSVRKGNANFLLLTNAPYVKVGRSFAHPYLEKAHEQTRCKVEEGNLLFFQRVQDHSLRLMLFDKTNGNVVIYQCYDRILFRRGLGCNLKDEWEVHGEGTAPDCKYLAQLIRMLCFSAKKIPLKNKWIKQKNSQG